MDSVTPRLLYLLYRRVGVLKGRSTRYREEEFSTHTGVLTPSRPARRESLSRRLHFLSYHNKITKIFNNLLEFEGKTTTLNHSKIHHVTYESYFVSVQQMYIK
jgi:hypothetical protein